MLTFSLVKNFIENKIRKGFTPNISGAWKHTVQAAYNYKASKQEP